MIILIFGVTNVGKTEVGKKLAEKLEYPFFDLDEQIKKTFHTTLEEFMKANPWPHERFIVKGKVLRKTIDENGKDMVIAVSPIYHARNFNYLLEWENVIAVELQDTEEHIFERLVFSDENDNIYRDDEYKMQHKDYYMKDIHEDIMYVKKTFQKIQWKYFVDNKSVEQVAEELYQMLPKKILEKRRTLLSPEGLRISYTPPGDK